MNNSFVRLDFKIIAEIIEPQSKVLDLGCGTGELLKYLVDEKKARVQGVEIDEDAIYKCVEKGLNVFHGDIDSGLKDYPDKTFDYIILNQSLQEVKKIDYVIEEAFRLSEKVIIGFPNFAHIQARFDMFFKGQAPVTQDLPNKWYDTPNLRFLSIDDFCGFCKDKKYKIIKSYFINGAKQVHHFPNLFARNAIFVISKG